MAAAASVLWVAVDEQLPCRPHSAGVCRPAVSKWRCAMVSSVVASITSTSGVRRAARMTSRVSCAQRQAVAKAISSRTAGNCRIMRHASVPTISWPSLDRRLLPGRDPMRDFRRLRPNMKGLRLRLDFAVRYGHALVLAQMLGPTVYHESLDITSGNRRIFEQSPADRAISAPDPAQRFPWRARIPRRARDRSKYSTVTSTGP